MADTVPVLERGRTADGRMAVTLAVGGTAWLERLLLQLGPHAQVLSPPDLVEVGQRAARRVLQQYRGPSRP